MRWQVPLAVRCKTIDQGKGHESASEYRKDFLDELWHAAPSTLHVHQRAKAGVQEIFIGTLDRRSLDDRLLRGRVRQLVERLCGFWAAGITAEAPLLKEAPNALASGTGGPITYQWVVGGSTLLRLLCPAIHSSARQGRTSRFGQNGLACLLLRSRSPCGSRRPS